jgi:hypothetical protein|tara:strand:- start:4365 stop:4943 length:579 start_codon:yes stop_codon:yes gene_type:complete
MKEKELDSLKNVLDMKEKEKELDSLKNEDYVKYFNKEIRDNWWKQDREVKKNILAAIRVMVLVHKDLIENNLKTTYIKKLAGNYNAINCKLSTNERLKDKSKKTTRDHIIGVALIGDTVWDSIKEKSLNKDNINDWTYNNLFLWGGVDMKRYEHNKNYIERDPKHDLMDKISFNHYLKLQDEIIEKIKKRIT